MRVLVLGAGYAGVTVARRLESCLPPDVELIVVDESESHLVQHEVHRVIRRPGLAETIRVPLTELFDRAAVRVARVKGLDREARTVHLDGGETLDYDYAAVCLGAGTAYYGLPGVEAHSLPLKRVADATAIRESFLSAMDEGDTLTAVVGGAGLSGVQTAGELAALADEEGVDANITVIEQLDDVAPNFPANFRAAVRDELEARGIDIRTSTAVERATSETVETETETFTYDTFVWAGGIVGQTAMNGDRPVVRSDLRLDDHTFVVGDAARIVDADGEPVPASASAALREARTVATNLAKLVRHDVNATNEFAPRMDPYRFDVPGWIVSVGDGAVAQLGPTVLTGSAAKAMKATVGAGHLGSVGAVQNAVELVESELGA
ncbi:FAD-dependent oxidoreductase [Halogeometricum borinquense]|uniref:FAD-dependent oxidoreductase n=1 Tax=Halogeometricum borinquense TaxID=60847 RepID=A0A6C0UFZ3_9EURY|nr:FAD-dependent oxidoreductase [Halogeometricum borinquense]QIB74140.1 FAD-dependent oxidoreductase [Halogeometricum borinquense]QIQ76653.1 FAD-dependent oxidoreductase [Halogeometricum borinquense]